MSQVFYCTEDGTVIHWDVNNPPIRIGSSEEIEISAPAYIDPNSADGSVSEEYSRGYENAMKDVLNEIARSGKQNLVQWLEARLKELS